MGCSSSTPVSPDPTNSTTKPSPVATHLSPSRVLHAKEKAKDEKSERLHEIQAELAASKADAEHRRALLAAKTRKAAELEARARKTAQVVREMEERRVKAAALAAAAAAKRQPPPRLPLPPPGAPTHPFSLQGTWTRESATGYHSVDDCPQYLLIPATSGQFTLTLRQGYKSPPAALALLKTQPRHARESGQPDVDFGEFTNVESPLGVTLEGGVSYTLLVCTFEGGLPNPEQTELEWGVTASPQLTLIHPLAPLTMPLKALLAQDAEEARGVERARRGAALARMQAKAQASPLGSTQRESWEDFCAAQAQVEVRREEVRAKRRLGGGGHATYTYVDGWSGTPEACGAGWEEGRKAVWVDWTGIAPHPVLVDAGFSLEDVVQGRLGDCYFLACLSELVSGGGGGGAVEEVLDSLFVTGEGNPEGVYCVRLWVGGGWRWFFMDSTLPCSHTTYINLGEPGVAYLSTPECGPCPPHGRYHAPLTVTSSNPSEMWAAMLEKAWAMLHTSYAACEGHVSVDTFPLNFFVPHSLPGFQIHTPPPDTPPSSPLVASLWRKLNTWKSREWPLTVGSRTKTRKSMGIVRGHAFTVLSVVSVGERSPLRLLELRNPHGSGEWEGKYSDKDLASWTPEVRAETGYSPEAGGDDGVFWMRLEDFVEQFGCVNVTPLITLVKDGGGWHKAEVRGGLLPTHAPAPAATEEGHWFTQLLAFPQYLLHAPSHPGAEFHVRLEVDGRPKRRDEVGEGGGVPRITLSPFEYVGGDGTAPARKADISFKPGSKPVLQGMKGEQFDHGVAFMDLHCEVGGSSLVVIPHIPGGSGEAAAHQVYKYTFTVHCDHPFTMRVVEPGAAASTDVGVVWVSNSKV